MMHQVAYLAGQWPGIYERRAEGRVGRAGARSLAAPASEPVISLTAWSGCTMAGFAEVSEVGRTACETTAY